MGLLAAGLSITACGGSTKTVTVSTPTSTAQSSGQTSTGGSPSDSHAKSGSKSPNSTDPSKGGAQSSSSGTQTGSGSGGQSPQSPNSSAPAAAGLTEHQLDNVESVHIVSRQGPYIIQQGVVTGPPIGNGTVVMKDRLTGTSVVVAFTVKGAQGTVNGRGTAQLHVSNGSVSYKGSAHIVSGTGIYSHVRAPHLTVIGTGSFGGKTTLHVTGTEWY